MSMLNPDETRTGGNTRRNEAWAVNPESLASGYLARCQHA
jgi:hypothetical protein